MSGAAAIILEGTCTAWIYITNVNGTICLDNMSTLPSLTGRVPYEVSL